MNPMSQNDKRGMGPRRQGIRRAIRLGAAAVCAWGFILGSNVTPVAASGNASPRIEVKASKADVQTGKVRIRVTVTNTDGSAVRMQVPPKTAKGSISKGSWPLGSSSGRFVYTPTAGARHGAARDEAGPSQKTDRFTISITDGNGKTKSVPIRVQISPQNSVPVADPIVGAPDASGVVVGSIRATDADGDPLTYAVTRKPVRGSVVVASDGTFVYTPVQTQARVGVMVSLNSSDCLTVTVTDGYGGAAGVPVCVQSNAT